MKHGQRNGMHPKRGRYPLAIGLIASALLHLLIVLVNPVMEARSYGRAAGTSPTAPGGQFTVLSLSELDDEDAIELVTTAAAAPRTATFGAPGAEPDDRAGPARGAGAAPGADATVAERLRYRTSPLWAPVEPLRESEKQRVARELRERVLKAAEEEGPLPATGVIQPSGGGIRIPFGFKPPPPAQTVPAPPLPDSILRRDSIRAAARAAARSDSIRKARDPAKLKSVAPRRPVVIPRVAPDTTAPEGTSGLLSRSAAQKSTMDA